MWREGYRPERKGVRVSEKGGEAKQKEKEG